MWGQAAESPAHARHLNPPSFRAPVNSWLQAMGLASLKPWLTTLLLPPVPALLLVLWGGWRLGRKRRFGATLLLTGVALVWAACTSAAGDALTRRLLAPPAPLQQPARLAEQWRDEGATWIVVLGAGRTESAEFGGHTLNPLSMERLRYGVWLSRTTGWPLHFSGGLSPSEAEEGGPSEGGLALQIARDEFRHPLRWAEDRSRDTRQNAERTIALLRKQPPNRLVVVTHDMHMPRALRHFEHASREAGLALQVVPASMGVREPFDGWKIGDFMPSPQGIARTRYALREWLGLLAGA